MNSDCASARDVTAPAAIAAMAAATIQRNAAVLVIAKRVDVRNLVVGRSARQKTRADPAMQIARAAGGCAVGIVIGREHLAEHAEWDAVGGFVPHHGFLG